MPLSDPYSPSAEALVRETHTQIVRARATHADWAEPLELDVERCRFGWDQRRVPRVEASLTCRVPEDQLTLNSLDPRTGVRIEIDAGYRYPGGREDVHTLVDLALHERRVERPTNTMQLTAMSDEVYVTETVATSALSPNQPDIAATVRWLVNNALTTDPAAWTDTFPVVAPDEPITLAAGDDYWNVIQDLAERVGGAVYDDGLRRWRTEVVPTVASQSAATLKVGANGTVITSDTGLSRIGWCNSVLLEYVWTNGSGVETTVFGRATASGGPYAPPQTQTRLYYERREVPIRQAQADQAAAAILRRRLNAGRNFTVSAVAYYWLRPGHTVTLQLPTGGQERLIVVAVDFDPIAGRMDLDLRLPDTVTNVTIGA